MRQKKLTKNRQPGTNDAQRDQSALVGAGQRDRREVAIRGGSGRRVDDRADAERQGGITATTNQAGRDGLTFYVDAVQTWQRYRRSESPARSHGCVFLGRNGDAVPREAWVIGDIQSKNPKLDYGVVPIPA